MNLLPFLLSGLLLLQSTSAPHGPTSPDVTESRTQVGQPMPSFTVTGTDGKPISMASLRGKVVLVNFWATWCGPCVFEMPRLEKEVWQRYKSDRFAMVAIAREQSVEEITPFRDQRGLTFPMAADPRREAYRLFADAGIPRSYVVGPDGTIRFQSVGYSPAEFDRMKKVIQSELANATR